MDEKTAPIPSLKDWENRRSERSAHTQRTGSMQTKGQMKRSADRQKASDNRKSQNTQRIQGAGANGSAQRVRYAQNTQRRPASAPREYARERNGMTNTAARGARPSSADYDASRRVERTPQNRMRSDINRQGGDGRRPVGSSQNQQRRGTSPQRRPAGNGRPPENRRPTENSRPTQSRGASASKSYRKPPRKPLSPRARRFRSICISVLMVLVVLVVGAILSLTVLFKTEDIVVQGNGAYSKQDIIDASGLILWDIIFPSPKSRAESKIEKKFPYVEKADVSSVFPNAIKIDITLAEPAYVIEGLGGFYTVSDKGKVLEVSATDDEADVPIIEGIEIEGKAAGEFVEYDSELVSTALEQLFAAFEQMGSEKITAINISASGDTFSMKYVYDDRIVVYIGLPEHIDYKVQTAHTIIKEKIDVSGSMIAGDLDVSLCYDTMKSYFNQYTLLSPHVAATQPEATEETTQEETQVYAY